MDNIKKVHLERLNNLIMYIGNVQSKEIALSRREISKIVGVSEGDSLKIIFKLLTENPELYNDSFTFKKNARQNIFSKQNNKEDERIKLQIHKKKEQLIIIKALSSIIEETNNILKNTKKISSTDFEVCIEFFQEIFDEIYTFLIFKKEHSGLIDESIELIDDSHICSFDHLYGKVEDMNRVLLIYNIISE